MKTLLFFCQLIIIFSLNGLSQNISTEKVEIRENCWGYLFISNGKKINKQELFNKMKQYSPAYQEMISARKNSTLGTVVGGIGSFIIGWHLGSIVSGKKTKWEMIALGTGIIGISIPISSRSHKQTINAVNLYNSSINTTSNYKQSSPELKIGYNGESFGLNIIIPINKR